VGSHRPLLVSEVRVDLAWITRYPRGRELTHCSRLGQPPVSMIRRRVVRDRAKATGI
jgi:hypothetical protein